MDNRQIPVNDHTANRDFDELPFTYVDPKNMHLYWVCNLDEDGKITSVYVNEKRPKGNNRYSGYLDTMEQAIYQRNELIKRGWREFKLPTVTVSGGGIGFESPSGKTSTGSNINRRQRRRIERMAAKEDKKKKNLEARINESDKN